MYDLQPKPVKKAGCFTKLLQGLMVAIIGIVIVVGIALLIPKSVIESARRDSATATAKASIIGTQTALAPTRTPWPTVTPLPNDTPTPIPTATLTVKQIQDTAKTMTFKELARNTEKHVGELLKFDGRVIQVMENSGNYELRVNVTKENANNWTDTIYLICAQCPTRPLEDDIASFVGVVDGRKTYQSALGGEITLPQLTARVFDVVTK